MSYRVFVRNWYRRNEYGSIVPGAGRKTTLDHVSTEDEARRLCRDYNSTHKPGPLSRKAEYEAR